MDKENKCCGFLGLAHLKKSQIFGLMVIVLAILLTFYTLEGLGILGMFLTGICMFKASYGCRCCCHQGGEESSCTMPHEHCDVKIEKKSKPKAKAK